MWHFRVPDAAFRWNPLEPPISDARRWGGIFSPVFANAAGFYPGQATENFGNERLLDLYPKYDTGRGTFPSVLDFRDYLVWLRANKKIDRYSEENQWFTRVLNRLESFCSAFGETVNCSRGFPLDEILAHHTVLDISALKPDAQSFFTETFLTQLVWRRMERGERGGALRTLAGFDEGKRLLPRYRELSGQGTSNMSNLVALAREFGIGFVVAECDPSLLGMMGRDDVTYRAVARAVSVHRHAGPLAALVVSHSCVVSPGAFRGWALASELDRITYRCRFVLVLLSGAWPRARPTCWSGRLRGRGNEKTEPEDSGAS